MKILHAPLDVGGHAAGLAAAERELGHESDVAVFSPGPFGYEAEIDLHAGADVSLPVRFGRRAAFLRKALRKYDVFHFNFGQTLLQVRAMGSVMDELSMIKRAGKFVIVTYQGCDVRPFEACFCEEERCRRESPYRPLAASRATKYADLVYHLNPDLSAYLPSSSFLPYASVDPRIIRPKMGNPDSGVAAAKEVVVLHAPTNRAVKGTDQVLKAVSELSAEGEPVRLRLLEGVQRSEVTDEIKESDIVVDQLMLGWYGGFAAEAMALGKPVVCSIDESANPFGERLPIVRADPGTLKDQINRLTADPELRAELGGKGRRFVEEVHDPRRVAARVIGDIESNLGQ